MFCFAGTTNDKISIKDVFHEVAGFDLEQYGDDTWQEIWRLDAPERCRNFLWLLYHDIILTNLSKNGKGLGGAACNLCGDVCETMMHAVRDCANFLHIWHGIVPSEIMGKKNLLILTIGLMSM